MARLNLADYGSAAGADLARDSVKMFFSPFPFPHSLRFLAVLTDSIFALYQAASHDQTQALIEYIWFHHHRIY
jgi:hypothetical protein